MLKVAIVSRIASKLNITLHGFRQAEEIAPYQAEDITAGKNMQSQNICTSNSENCLF